MGNIEIKIAYGKVSANVSRLFHDKAGIFCDGSNYVSFRGSVNETFKGLSNNGKIESISLFTSCANDSHHNRVSDDMALFQRIWNNQAAGLTVTSLPEDIKTKIKSYGRDVDWETLVDEISTDLDKIQSLSADPKGGRLPRPHQVTALQNWINNNHRGVLEHATGSGKTFTSLCAIRYAISKRKSVIILVPSTELLAQWNAEVRNTLLDLQPNILLCGDGHTWWKKPGLLHFMTSPFTSAPKITISTMDTAVTEDFMCEVNQGDHLFVVSDEVHRMGTPRRRHFFSLNAGFRLGVSATPRRYGDEFGTQAILKYFGGILTPVYSLQDAIRDQVLTPYFYSPQVISLNEEEQAAWIELSKKIRNRFLMLGVSETNTTNDERLKKLLLQRSRLIKKAKGKEQLALKILSDRYHSGQKWIVYCEDKSQLFAVRDLLMAKVPHIDILEYYSDMPGDKTQTLKFFSEYGGVIVSIRCLDEGVDIPATTHALILASSK
ncbi:MAG: DEAD/DEAH box helicase family protein, partial [Tannerellaceae bacterium]|nr:DEAD/DEAH box helicase family protein [Tannerellaceae bacterium]